MTSSDKQGHGGRRSNAGRKSLGKDSVIIRLKYETHAALKEAAAAAETSKSEYVEEAILDKIARTAKSKPSSAAGGRKISPSDFAKGRAGARHE